jgi:hypothetical protein
MASLLKPVLSIFPVLGLLKPVTDSTKQNPSIVSEVFPNFFFLFVDIKIYFYPPFLIMTKSSDAYQITLLSVCLCIPLTVWKPKSWSQKRSVCMSACVFPVFLLGNGLANTFPFQRIHTQQKKHFWTCGSLCGSCRIKGMSVCVSPLSLLGNGSVNTFILYLFLEPGQSSHRQRVLSSVFYILF